MAIKNTILIISFAALLVFNACTRSNSTPNSPPVAGFYKAGNILVSTSSDPEQDTLSHSWVIDGQTYTGPSVTLTNPTGKKTVLLTVSDGKTTVQFADEIDFTPNNLVANISASVTSGVAPLSVNFDSSQSTDESNQIVTRIWDFNDDGLEDSREAAPSHTYTNNGQYRVKLTIIDNDGNNATATETITVGSGTPPTAVISALPSAGQAPLSVTFNGNGSSDAGGGSIVSYSWSIDGAAPNTGQSISHTFLTPGTYNVALTVTDDDGLIDTDTFSFNVSANAKPQAVGTASIISTTQPIKVLFDGSGSTDDIAVTSYKWVIEGQEYDQAQATHDFTSNGPYIGILTVTDGKGLTDSTTVTIASNDAPIAVATASVTSGSAPLSVLFDGSQSTDDKGVTAYSWSIDGTTKQGEMVNHTFNTIGAYNVTLTVSDADGFNTSTTVTINVVANQAPVAVINAPVTSGQAPLTINLSGSASTDDNGIQSYQWNIDGLMLSGVSLDYTFSESKTYTVELTVSDAQGLMDTATIDIITARDVPDVLPPYNGVIPLIKMKGDPSAPLQTVGNPFSDSYFYASPDVYHAINETSLDFETPSQSADSMYQKMKYTQRMPSAVWMDSIATIYGSADRRSLIEHLDAALAQQKDYQDNTDGGMIAPMNVVVIIYNLPDRDCAALASSGLLVEVGDDTKIGDPAYDAEVGQGLMKYRSDYIDVIADTFDDPKYDSLRIVAMLEPDSYPNMITNQNPNLATDAYCIKLHNRNNDTSGESGVYTEGLRYAIKEFAADNNSNVYTYIDIGHSGWLGWDNNRDFGVNGGTTLYWNTGTGMNDEGGKAIGFTNLVDGADGAVDGNGFDMIRGFASNTSGYTPLFEPFFDGKNAQSEDSKYFEYNTMVDELHFMQALYNEFQAAGFSSNKLGFIIDTARNGWGKDDGPTQYRRPTSGPAAKNDDSLQYRVDKRTQRGRWCNVMDAGVGESPQADPLAAHPWIDAFYWMKPPGESDGSSNPADENAVGKSYDPVCGGVGTPKTGMVAGRVIGNAAGLDTRTDSDNFYAPTAGLWFDEQYRMLIDNSYPALGSYGDYSAYDYNTAVPTP